MWASLLNTRCYAIHVSQTHSLVYILSMLHSSTVEGASQFTLRCVVVWASLLNRRCHVVHVSQLHSLVYILSMLHSSTVRCFTVYSKVCSYVGFTTEHKVSCYPCSTAAQSGVYCPCFTAVQCFTAAAQEGVLCPWLSAENAGLAFFFAGRSQSLLFLANPPNNQDMAAPVLFILM